MNLLDQNKSPFYLLLLLIIIVITSMVTLSSCDILNVRPWHSWYRQVNNVTVQKNVSAQMEHREVTRAARVVFMTFCEFYWTLKIQIDCSLLSKRKISKLTNLHYKSTNCTDMCHSTASAVFTCCWCGLPSCWWMSILQQGEHRRDGAPSVQCSMCVGLDPPGSSWGPESAGEEDNVSSVSQWSSATQQAEWSWNCSGPTAAHENHCMMFNTKNFMNTRYQWWQFRVTVLLLKW